jgi:putative SOS response-associated peptidase YedK
VLFSDDWARWLDTEVDATELLGPASSDRFTVEKVAI